MSYSELFVSHGLNFSGYQTTFAASKYVVFGVPFDITSTFRTGARFAPTAIREASLNIETYSFRSDYDIENLKIQDLGDLHVTSTVTETLERVEKVTAELLKNGKTPIAVGGEHTITLGTVRATSKTRKNLGVISFDAHLDLRDEYMGLETSHTTFMRRINHQANPKRIVEVGSRAVCKEELQYARESKNIEFITSNQIHREGAKKTAATIKTLLENCSNLYLTIDTDVLDPAFAPAVQNPEPDGLDTHTLLEILSLICDKRVVALDLVEVTPPYDHGVTSMVAAKTLFETMSALEKAHKK